jgi:hypothetical protein
MSQRRTQANLPPGNPARFNAPARADQEARDPPLKQRHVERQQQHPKRQHPEAEDGQDRQEAADDEQAGDRLPEPAKAPVQQRIDDPA